MDNMPTQREDLFGDFDPEDAFNDGDTPDEEIDWDQVINLQNQIDALYDENNNLAFDDTAAFLNRLKGE